MDIIKTEIDESDTSSESEEIVKTDTLNLLPNKSKKKYEKQYQLFVSWCSSRNLEIYSENVLIAYISDKSKTMKSSTLWCIYSMLKTTLAINNNVDISEYKKLTAFLKRQAVGYKSQKSKAFTEVEIEKFLLEAPDELFLMKKVILIIGIAGACKRDELVKMNLSDVDDKDSILIIKIPDSETNKGRVFAITKNEENTIDYLSIYRKYRDLRPQEPCSPRLFLRYNNGKCFHRSVGMNTIGQIPKDIAQYLNLSDVDLYTGHCFRRTSATLLAKNRVDWIQRKRYGGRKSSNVEVYREENMNDEMDIDRQILLESPSVLHMDSRETEMSTNSETQIHTFLEENDESDAASEIKEITKTDAFNSLPKKSKKKYEKQYQLFVTWCDLKKFETYSENVLIAYITEKSQTMKSSSLWSIYSMLKTTLAVKNDVDISKYKKLTAFLKRKAVGYKSQKSKSFTEDEIEKFLLEAPDELYLMKKVILIIGIAGACKRDELVKMTIDDVEDKNSILIIKIPDSETSKGRVFAITENEGNSIDYLSIYRKYRDLRPQEPCSSRLFLRYSNGKCFHGSVGMNTIGQTPKDIAQYLNLPDIDLYTGHCFRRTSILLANNKGDWTQRKRYEGWKHSSVEVYLEEHFNDEIGIDNKIALEPLSMLQIHSRETEISSASQTVNQNLNFLEEMDESDTSLESEENVKTDTFYSLPKKSKKKYEKQYQLFMTWCSSRKQEIYSENVLIAYISEKSKTTKSSTLYSIYSMLKTMLALKNNIDITEYRKLTAFLKQHSVGNKSQKSKAFTEEEITKFLLEAPDESFLMKKVILIIGIAGACRRNELVKMTINDVEDKNSALLITIPDSETNKARVFAVTKNEEKSIDYLSIYRKYIDLRPQEACSSRLFLQYNNGKCLHQGVSRNIIGQIPQDIAQYLNLPDIDLYTSHCFSRTSAALLANNRDDWTQPKRHGGWGSSNVEEVYLEENANDEKHTVQKIVLEPSSTLQIHSRETEHYEITTTSEKAASSIFISNCHNCTFTFNIVKDESQQVDAS